MPRSARFVFIVFVVSAVFAHCQTGSPCSTGNCDNGEGTFHYENGAIYTGQFADGAPSGQGRFVAPNGHSIAGSWKDGRPNGYAVSKLPNGSSYEGEYVDGKPDGIGTEILPNGLKLTGRWSQGKPNGEGKLYDSTGLLLLDGIFKNGSFPDEYGSSPADNQLIQDTEKTVLLAYPGCSKILKVHAFLYQTDARSQARDELWIFDICGRAHGRFITFTPDPKRGTLIHLAMGKDNRRKEPRGEVSTDRETTEKTPFHEIMHSVDAIRENWKRVKDPADQEKIRKALRELEKNLK